MKRFTNVVAVLGFALASSTALADRPQLDQAKLQPVQMTDAQLDTVAAGQVIVVGPGLVDVTVGPITLRNIEVRALNNNEVFVPVDVAANINAVVAVLGNAAGFARQLGRQ